MVSPRGRQQASDLDATRTASGPRSAVLRGLAPESSSEVIRKPDSVKKVDTPRNPPGIQV